MRVVVIVAVDDVPGATPVTVTRPVPLIATDPDAVAVPVSVVVNEYTFVEDENGDELYEFLLVLL